MPDGARGLAGSGTETSGEETELSEDDVIYSERQNPLDDDEHNAGMYTGSNPLVLPRPSVLQPIIIQCPSPTQRSLLMTEAPSLLLPGAWFVKKGHLFGKHRRRSLPHLEYRNPPSQ